MSEAKAHNDSHGEAEYRFQVDDGKPVSTNEPIVTGAKIKALAGVEPKYALFLEGKGKEPDTQIYDDTKVDLREPGLERFYSMPPATFGAP